MARLILESGGQQKEIPLKSTVVIGRQKTATIPIQDKLLSREHARINVEKSPDGSMRYHLQDLGSKNGTYLNGQLVKRTHALQHGDKIKIGSHVFAFLMDPGESPAVVAAPAPRPAGAAPHVPPPPPAQPAPPPAAKPSKPPTKQLPQPAHARPPSGRRLQKILGSMPAPTTVFAFNVFLIAVLVVGAFVSRTAFLWVFEKFLPK